MNCSTLVGVGAWVAAQTPGTSILEYDSLTDTYQRLWKIDKSWRGTCRAFELELVDGTVHLAYFIFR